VPRTVVERAAALTAALLIAAVGAQGQRTTEEGAWPVYGGDAAFTRYSPLDQIDSGNAERLAVAWRRPMGPLTDRPEVRSQTTPLYVDGRLFVTAGFTRHVVALDPASGEVLWQWDPAEEEERLADAPRVNSGRGVAWWGGDGGPGRLLVVTPGYRLAALHPGTGAPVVAFGDGGVVDLMEGHRVREGVPLVGTIGASAPPLVAGDVIVVGSAHHVGMRPPSRVNTPGDIRGFDVRTGELLWTFNPIPEPGEAGHETWLDDAWRFTGNAGVWTTMSYDPESGLVYLPTEAATGDYFGGHRPGENLFSSSVVALDARTGERRWHFQIIHHDIWDWDNPTAPILADVTVDGRARKLAVQLTKQSFAYVFDRITGEPIWPIEERPVPQSDVPGEWTSPTQPIPTRPAPYDRQGFSEADLIALTPEVHERARRLASRYRMGGLYTPPSVKDAPDGTQGTLSLPSAIGGANWEGGALDPETGMLYVPSMTNASVLALEPGGADSDMDWIAARAATAVLPGVPMVQPPWGRITAIDLTTGDHRWQVANGDTPPPVAERLGVPLEDLPRTGKVSRAGLVVTATLLFAGEGMSGAPVFRAHDKATGEILAELELPAAQVGLPMTYLHEGRQYVAMAVGGGEGGVEIVALALPAHGPGGAAR
jgi:quinoprotein glucose dehydrogenase